MLLRSGVVAVFIQIGGIGEPATPFQLDELRLQSFTGILFAEVVRVPHQVGVAIDNRRVGRHPSNCNTV